ncbi:MAG: amidohydrolase family protein, partial [Gemmatimonadetes bacterium]|nr:amidohydrolase family protein [Gemmatimonadota bacterium]
WFVDPRLWDLLSPDSRAEEEARHRALEGAASAVSMRAALQKSMEFEVAFFRAGGLLAAGVDPAFNTPAGIGDQRNYELLIEAGLTPTEAIQVMTLNGARILGIADQVGSVAPGKRADLVVIRGDLAARPTDIRNVVTVFRDGLGYDAVALINAAKGLVGLR